MDRTADIEPGPPGLPLAFASLGVMGVGLFAWGFLAIWSTSLRSVGSTDWLIAFGTLAGIPTGSFAAYKTRRWWPFFAGVAITLIPVLLLVLVFVLAPGGTGAGD
jgi:hypothetical protein